jgi:hypothetical protein
MTSSGLWHDFAFDFFVHPLVMRIDSCVKPERALPIRLRAMHQRPDVRDVDGSRRFGRFRG